MNELRVALKESLKLQSHYARLLNQYDGGERMPFDTIEDWIQRLRKTGTLTSHQADPADEFPVCPACGGELKGSLNCVNCGWDETRR